MYVAPCNVENSQTFVFLDHHLTAFTLAVTSVYLMISPKMANLEHRLRMLKIACKSSRFIANFCTSDSQQIVLSKFQYTKTLMTSHTFTDRPHLPVQTLRCKMLKNKMLVHHQTSFVCCTGVEVS